MIKVIGAGLAGCEAAFAIAESGIPVTLYEMKPEKYSPAHKYSGFAELVCSNSLKAKRIESAAGLLKEEMRLLGSIVIKEANTCSVDAGGALAVDRYQFSDRITAVIESHPLIKVVHHEQKEIPKGPVVVATGPLTSDNLSQSISRLCGSGLSFYDAAAPIVSFDSIDMNRAFFASRYGRGGDDYINCPFTKEEYEIFHEELIKGQTVPLKEFETEAFKVYEGCMPIEVMAKRGSDTIRFGPMRPVGIIDPKTGKRPYAVVQLRKEDRSGKLFNMVGFQTNLRFPEQKRIFSLIPGLENTEYVRYGVMHRNTFLNSPTLLDSYMRLKTDKEIYFAGQITGIEGYIESAASGLVVGINAARIYRGSEPILLPQESMIGSLLQYVCDESVSDFQPMGCNMGLLPPLNEPVKGKQARYEKLSQRALQAVSDASNIIARGI